MRNALTPIALLIAVCSFSQPLDRVEVVSVDSTRSAADLYRTAERWYVDTFKDAQEVIQLRDTVTRTIVGKGAKSFGWVCGEGIYTVGGASPCAYSFEVACKEGRYRAKLYDVSIHGAPVQLTDTCYVAFPNDTGPKKTRMMPVQIRDQVCSQLTALQARLFGSLKAAMVKPKDDW